jgi:hypothetical protein
MFLPSGSDYRFAEPSTTEGANWVSGNREKTLFAVISRSSIYIYQANVSYFTFPWITFL